MTRADLSTEEELGAIAGRLRSQPAWVSEVDLTGGVRAGLAAPARRRHAPRRALAAAALGLAAAAGLFLVVRGRGGGEEDAGFRAKGGAAGGPDRWSGIHLFHVDGDRPDPITDRLPRGEVLVSYTNLGPRPYDFLMVFAVDARGEVRWFYPAWEDPSTDPQAIAIERGVADAALPDLVEQEVAAGRVFVCGLFLRRPLSVSQIETALAERPGADLARTRLPLADAGQHCVALDREAE